MNVIASTSLKPYLTSPELEEEGVWYNGNCDTIVDAIADDMTRQYDRSASHDTTRPYYRSGTRVGQRVWVIRFGLCSKAYLTRVAFSPSSENWNRPSTLRSQRFVVPIILSHHPPYQAALRAINFQRMLWWARNRWVLAANREDHSWARCLLVAWKFWALSV